MSKGDGRLRDVREEQISGVNRLQGGFGEHWRGGWNMAQILKSFANHTKTFGFCATGNEELPRISNGG